MKHETFSRKLKFLVGIAAAILSIACALAQPPTSSNPPVTADSSNNWLPALRNGFAPNLPAGTKMGGVLISTGSGLPSMTGNSGNLLTTNGTIASWVARVTNANLPLGALVYDNAGTPIIAANFGTRTFKNGGGVTTLDFGGSEMFDGAGIESIDWNNRYLLAQDGISIVVNWAAADAMSIFGNFTVYANGNVELGGYMNAPVWDGTNAAMLNVLRQLIANDGSTVALDWSDPTKLQFFDGTSYVTSGGAFTGNGSGLTAVSASTVAGVTNGSNAAAGQVGEYITASRVVGSATALTTATPKTVTSISLTAGDWDVTAIGALTGASTGTEFDVAIGTTTNSLTGTVLGDTRCQTPTVSLTGADASLMVPSVRVSISSTTTYYLIVQETFTVGSPAAYGRISARRMR